MRTLCALVSLLMLISCSSENNFEQVDKLFGVWDLQLVTIDGDLSLGPPQDSKIDITFSKESKEILFRGNTLCNNLYGGTLLSITTRNIHFDEISSTEIACINNEFLTFEIGYLNWLKSSRTYELNTNSLVLHFDYEELTGKLIFEKR